MDPVTPAAIPLITRQATQLLTDADQEEILHMHTSFDMYASPTVITVPINRLPTLGLILTETPTTQQVFVKNCQEGTAVSKINKWRSLIRNSVVRSVNNKPVRCIRDFIDHVATARRNYEPKVEIRFARPAIRCDDATDILQLHFDQLRHLNQLHVELRQPQNELIDAFLNYTRAQLKKREDYQEWRRSEWSQLDKYELQNMFGTPISRPFEAIILPFVWTYLMKEDPLTGILKRKAWATCNGGKKYGKAVTVAETYATCVEQPACKVYWAMTAQLCLIAMGADAGNAFAEAPPATEPFYMRIDDQFREWWTECQGRPPIPPGYVLPVNHALQGHPEAPRLWERHIHDILVNKLQFVPTTHEKCLYSRRDSQDNLQMILRQVDDFSVSAMEQQECREIID
jgi:hypothetical protein